MQIGEGLVAPRWFVNDGFRECPNQPLEDPGRIRKIPLRHSSRRV